MPAFDAFDIQLNVRPMPTSVLEDSDAPPTNTARTTAVNGNDTNVVTEPYSPILFATEEGGGDGDGGGTTTLVDGAREEKRNAIAEGAATFVDRSITAQDHSTEAIAGGGDSSDLSGLVNNVSAVAAPLLDSDSSPPLPPVSDLHNTKAPTVAERRPMTASHAQPSRHVLTSLSSSARPSSAAGQRRNSSAHANTADVQNTAMGASAVTSSLEPPKTAKAAAAAYKALSLVLAPHGAESVCDLLVSKGWTCEALGRMTESGMNRLKITGRATRNGLMAAAAEMRTEAAMSPVERLQRQRMREGMYKAFGGNKGRGVGGASSSLLSFNKAPREGRAAGVVPKAVTDTITPGMLPVDDDAAEDGAAEGAGVNALGRAEFTATLPTANEHARQATIFLEHQRLDRAWPNGHSKLAQTLNLSNAAPVDSGPLYTINVNGSPTPVSPPRRHNQGFQAKFCPCCADFVAEGLPGRWQFLGTQRVVKGPDDVEVMSLWKDFKESESVSIEYSKKRMNKGVKIRKTLLNFETMRWGDRPVRRVHAKSVPFPSLRQADITHAPLNDADAANMALQEGIDALNRRLISDTEETRNRIAIENEERFDINAVLDTIVAMMASLFERQRASLEEEEALARARIVDDDFEAAIDALYALEERSVRHVEVRVWENQSLAIFVQQCALLEGMEVNKRIAILEEEEAARANLARLLELFNDQVRHVLAARKAKFLAATRGNGKGGRPKESEGSLEGRRCPVCRKTNCVFFHRPWKGQWRGRGGALDLQPPILDTVGDLNALVSRANAREYEEDEKTRLAKKKELKAQKRLMAYLGISSSPHHHNQLLESAPMAQHHQHERQQHEQTADDYHFKAQSSAAKMRANVAAAGLSADGDERNNSTHGHDLTRESIVRDTDTTAAEHTTTADSEAHEHAASFVSHSTSSFMRPTLSSRPSSAQRIRNDVSAANNRSSWTPPPHGGMRPRPFLPSGGGSPFVTAYSVTRSTKHTPY